jgi:integrase
MAGKRRFGRVRRLPSGRYQARYLGPDGADRPAPQTFGTKREAEVWLALKEGEIRRGDWLDPSAGAVPFAKYAADWMGQGHFSPKTTQLYELLLRRHLLPTFGDTNIADIRQEDVRAWRARRLRAGPQQKQPFGPVTVAKAYRLLRAILNTAVRDKRIRENPCQIKGADRESSPERPVLSVAEVYRLADAIEPRYRALILLATFGNLRWGELAGLRRRNLDLGHRVVRVVETVYELDRLVKGTPKSEASTRKITLPELIIPELRRHLDIFTPAGPDAFVFVHVQGGQLRRSNFSKPWARALGEAGLPSSVHVLSRPGARFRCCHQPVSPDRSPNPPCRSPGSGLSTVPAVRRGSQGAMGPGSCSPGRRSGRPSRPRSGSTPPRPPRSAAARPR